MSRSRRFMGGLTAGYLTQACLMLAGLWITPFILRQLGPHEYGLWLILMQTVTYVAILDFGVVALLPRDIAYVTGRFTGEQQKVELKKALSESVTLLFYQTPAACLVAVVIWWTLSRESDELRIPLALVLGSFVLLIPARIFQAGLLGMQDLALTAKLQALCSLLMVALFAFFVRSGLHLYSLPLSWVLTQSLLALLCRIRLRKEFGNVLPHWTLKLSARRVMERAARGGWVTVSQLAQILLSGADLFIIGNMLGPAAVVTYSLSGKLITVLSNQPAAILQSAGPALSELRASESSERQLQACNALSQATLILSGLIACAILATNRGFVTWWVGPQHFGGMILTALLLVVMLLRQWNGSLVYALFCFGGERRIAITTFIDGVTTVCGTVLMIRVAGLSAAPVGSIAGACLISLPMNVAGLLAATGKPIRALISPLLPWAIRFVALSGIIVIVGRGLNLVAPNLLVTATLVITAVYAVVMISPANQEPLGGYVRAQITSVRRWFIDRPSFYRSRI